ncbi:MAG: ABC transporter ATP-binding protein [Christensenellaceae bacterium]|nr:ABC transporter ATP-binding protein [Christensenellaceae bacterium]
MEPILQCRELTKKYKIDDAVVTAIEDVSLDIYPGELVCIVGTSGSGKSTLLYLLAGIERPTKGKIRILSKRIDIMNESELTRFRRDNVGFIFQSFNLLPYMTALDNVALPLMLRGEDSFSRKKKAAQMLKTVGLAKRFKHKPMQLSGGQQQRVSIARAIVAEPKILFADEPTGNLDSNTSREIMELLVKQVRQSGATLIMVTHDTQNEKYADTVIRISDGKIPEVIKKNEEN